LGWLGGNCWCGVQMVGPKECRAAVARLREQIRLGATPELEMELVRLAQLYEELAEILDHRMTIEPGQSLAIH
jgi:hypothetical protein